VDGEGRASDGAAVTPTHGIGLAPVPSLSAEGRLRRAGKRREEARFVTGGNTANPRIGSRAKQTCTVEEE
jgi:hypothetical protein